MSIHELTGRVCDVMALHHEAPPDFIAKQVSSSLKKTKRWTDEEKKLLLSKAGRNITDKTRAS